MITNKIKFSIFLIRRFLWYNWFCDVGQWAGRTDFLTYVLLLLLLEHKASTKHRQRTLWGRCFHLYPPRFSCYTCHPPPCYSWYPSSALSLMIPVQRLLPSLRLALAYRVNRSTSPFLATICKSTGFSLVLEITLVQQTFMILLEHWLTEVWTFLMIDFVTRLHSRQQHCFYFAVKYS